MMYDKEIIENTEKVSKWRKDTFKLTKTIKEGIEED